MQLTFTDELEVLISPEGILPVITFLKHNQLCQFTNLSDLTAVDIPTRACRFEVRIFILCFLSLKIVKKVFGTSTLLSKEYDFFAE